MGGGCIFSKGLSGDSLYMMHHATFVVANSVYSISGKFHWEYVNERAWLCASKTLLYKQVVGQVELLCAQLRNCLLVISLLASQSSVPTPLGKLWPKPFFVGISSLKYSLGENPPKVGVARTLSPGPEGYLPHF